MSATDDELLERLLAGDLDPASPVWKDAVALDPSLARRADELRALHSELDRAGADEREALRLAQASATEEDLRIVRRAFGSARRDWWRRRSTLYVAAALLIAIGGFWFALRRAHVSNDRPSYLGDQRYAAIEPTTELGDARLFRWKGEPPAGGWFVVRIFDVDGRGEPGRMALESDRCPTNSWQPAPNEIARMPSEFFWEVEVLRLDQHYALSAPQRALRSRF